MATKKKTVSSDEKFTNQDFDLFRAIEAVDKKDYDWLSNLTEEQQRKFVPYMMAHWISAVKGRAGAYYVMSTDMQANKYLFNERVQQHPGLQWLMLCAASPGIGKQFHQWIPHLSNKISQLKEPADRKTVGEYFAKIYPNVAAEDIKSVAQEFTDEQRHRYRLAQQYPNMKIDDIMVLSEFVSPSDLELYEKESGN